MNLKQKLLSLGMVVMPVVDATVLFTVFKTASVSHAQSTKTSAATQLVAQESPELVGRTWQAEDNKFRLQFFKENNLYNGKIVWLPPGAETKDVKNPDPKMRSRSLIGSVMLKGFTYDPSKKQLVGGTIYIAQMGRSQWV
jgi:Uncharacterized protein conserved in bacteria (DUF2147)